MAEGTALVDIQKAQYTLLGVDGLPRARLSVNGLLHLVEGDVMILTGTAEGPVRLTVETHSDAPPLDLEGWEDIVEVSQRSDVERSATGEIAVAPLFDGPVEGLPVLTLPDRTTIRIRVHARGRDAAAKYNMIEEPIEEHLLQVWPAPEADEICHRLTDRYGETSRRQWRAMHHPSHSHALGTEASPRPDT